MSSSTGDYPDGPSRKRLRKGTRSCQECRRRKVRCVWPQQSQRCDECNSRRIQCIEQDVYIPRSESTKPTDSKTVHQRLDDLETTLSHLMKNDSPANKSMGTIEGAVTGAITNLREDTYLRSSRSPILSQARSEDLSRSTSGDIEESLHEAPVLSLFRGHVSAQQTTDPYATSHENETKEVQELRTLLLSVDDFSRILASGQYTRHIWHRTFPESVKVECVSSQDPSSPDEDIREHYANSLESSNLGLLTRVSLCLAIHLQQLPRSFDFSKISQSSPSLQSLQDHYLAKAEMILALDSELGNSVDSIECKLLACEFHINRGHPRKAWMTIRRAIDTAYLLNLHRKQENSRFKSLWFQLSFYDRNLALVLGLPNSIPDAHLKGKLENEFLERLELIMGRVVDRNINHASMTLDNTLKIDHEMEECRKLKSDNWWNTSPSFDLPMPGNSVYQMFVAKVLFHNTRKLLHLPYMLKSYTDIKYRISRTIALESSRAMIRVFAVLHGDPNPALHLCEMVDFQIFTAALLVLIDILMDPLCRSGLKHREDDWELVHTTIKIMKHISETMLCNLATQAAQLLNDLRCVDLFAPSPLEFEVLIPYFGKFFFRKGDTSSTQAETVAAVDKTSNDLSNSNMTDVDFPLLSDVGFDLSQNCFQPWEELDFDWSSISDPSLYDSWNWSMDGLRS